MQKKRLSRLAFACGGFVFDGLAIFVKPWGIGLDLQAKADGLAKELADAKRDILANLAFARDGNNSSVMAFTRLGVGFTVEQIDNLPSKINAVTPTQVQEAANFVLSKNPVAIATIYPEGYKEKQKLEELQCTQLRQNQNNVTVPPIPQNEINKK